MRRRFLVASAAVALVLLSIGAVPVGAAGGPTPDNPGFEADGTAVPSPTGWKSYGTRSADFTEAGGHGGSFRLSHWSAAAYSVDTKQTLKALTQGWYTLRAWVRRGTGENNSYIALEKCGKTDARTWLPVSTSGWLQITATVNVTTPSTCMINLHTDAAAGEWANFDDIEIAAGAAHLSVLGGDVSSLTKSEDLGGVYRDENGKAGDALAILKAHGLDWIRVRAFVDPADGYHGTAELLSMAARAKALGLKILIDLHYSDFWADPGKQWTPAAWEGQTFAQLKATFSAYTREVVKQLVDQGTPPDMIQLGNEITPGMLWDYAATWTGCSTADDGYNDPATYLTVCHTENWDNLAELLTAGYETVKAVSPTTKVMLQLDAGGNNGTYQWWFGNITSRHVPFDVIGASYYAYWHGTFADLQYNLNDVSQRYDKDVIVVETAYPFTVEDDDGTGNVIWTDDLVAGYPATPAGQAANFRDVMTVVRAVPNGRGLGVFYWDPTWTAVDGNGWSPRNPDSGNAWENQALFDFNDRALPAMSEFRP